MVKVGGIPHARAQADGEIAGLPPVAHPAAVDLRALAGGRILLGLVGGP